jgi:fructokinase
MRKIIGIGETILDIIFENNQPQKAVPGGSVFNGLISLGRMGLDVSFISEIGNDQVGQIIQQFMHENNIGTQHIDVFPDGKSPISLAFLDENSDAHYSFYKNYPKQRLEVAFPPLQEDDIVIFGSYFALNPVLRLRVKELLDYAVDRKAIIYYDPNFRSTHCDEVPQLEPTLMENYAYASIIRGSDEDFANIYRGETNLDFIYKHKIQYNCPNFITTAAAKGVGLYTPTIQKKYKIAPINTISTIGAGDNFNAGILYGIIKYDIKHKDLDHLDTATWDQLIQCGIDFSANTCQSYENSISRAFAEAYK